VLVLATFSALAWSRCALRPRDLLLLLVSLYAGLGAIRMIPLFALIAVPVVSRCLGIWARENSRAQFRLNPDRTLPNVVILLAMIIFVLVHVMQVIKRQPEAEAQQFPVRAGAFLQAHPAVGPIFNHYDWGGYLIWKLYPPTRVFIDGRADIYGQAPLDQFAATYQLKGAWKKALKDWGVTTVIVPRDSALAAGLQISPGWNVAYEDQQAIILTVAHAH
jgi:hypothetical protein